MIKLKKNRKVVTSEYKEKMRCSKKDTLMITAYSIHDGKDVAKDNKVVKTQMSYLQRIK